MTCGWTVGTKEGLEKCWPSNDAKFLSLDVPSVFYLFFALSVLLFLLTVSCLCALCTTTYMWTKAGIHRPFLPKREKKVICIFANIFIFHFRKILLFVFLEFFNSNFSLIFQKEEQVVVLSTVNLLMVELGKATRRIWERGCTYGVPYCEAVNLLRVKLPQATLQAAGHRADLRER